MLNFADFGLDINILLFIGAGLVIGVCGYFLTAVTGLFYI